MPVADARTAVHLRLTDDIREMRDHAEFGSLGHTHREANGPAKLRFSAFPSVAMRIIRLCKHD